MTAGHTDGMTRVLSVAPTQPAFDEVAALFDDYRVHFGLPSSPEGAR